MGNKAPSQAKIERQERRRSAVEVRNLTKKFREDSKRALKEEKKMALLLERKGFDLNDLHKTSFYRFSEVTPLAFACMVGDVTLLAYVFTHGGAEDITRADFDGWTPLLRAARQGSVEVVAWLCERGAADDLWRPNVKGDTPLGEAARMGHLQVVQFLVLSGALEPGPPGCDRPKGGAAALVTPAKSSSGRGLPNQSTLSISEEVGEETTREPVANDSAETSEGTRAVAVVPAAFPGHDSSEEGGVGASQSIGAAEAAPSPSTAAGNDEEWVLVGDNETISTVPGSPLDGHRCRKRVIASPKQQLPSSPPPHHCGSSHLDDECAICLELLVDQGIRNSSSSNAADADLRIERLPCGHCFHKECVVGLRGGLGAKRAASCPLCRAALPPAPGEVSWHATHKFLAVKRRVELGIISWEKLQPEDIKALHAAAVGWRDAEAAGEGPPKLDHLVPRRGIPVSRRAAARHDRSAARRADALATRDWAPERRDSFATPQASFRSNTQHI